MGVVLHIEPAPLTFKQYDPDPPSLRAAVAEVERSAREYRVSKSKERARVYLFHPGQLDLIEPGLSRLTAHAGVRAIRERRRRLFGGARALGSFVQVLNLRGAEIAFRWRRRFEIEGASR